MHRLKHQQRPPQIPPTLPRNPLIQPRHNAPPLLPPRLCQNFADIDLSRRRNPHQQRPRPDRRNDIRRTIRQQDQPQIRAILLHRPPQRRLRIPRQMIRLVDHHDLEPLLSSHINLLRLGYFFEQVLDHHPIVVADIRGSDFEMVDRGYDVEFEFAV